MNSTVRKTLLIGAGALAASGLMLAGCSKKTETTTSTTTTEAPIADSAMTAPPADAAATVPMPAGDGMTATPPASATDSMSATTPPAPSVTTGSAGSYGAPSGGETPAR